MKIMQCSFVLGVTPKRWWWVVLSALWCGGFTLDAVSCGEEAARLEQLEALQGRFVMRFSPGQMADGKVAGESPVKTVSGLIHQRVIDDLSDNNLDDVFSLGDHFSLSLESPFEIRSDENRSQALVRANLKVTALDQGAAITLPLALRGTLSAESSDQGEGVNVFTITGIGLEMSWVPGDKAAGNTQKRKYTWQKQNREFITGMPAHPMSYHSPQQLHIPFTPIPQPPLPKCSPLSDTDGVFPENANSSPFSSSPELGKPADKPEFGTQSITFPEQHTPFS